MIYLVWVAVFFCIAGALALLFDERMEYCLAPALCGGILLLYLFGLFGLLKPGLAAVALCGAVSAGYCLVRCVHGRTLFLRQWLTPAMLLALVGVAYIAWMQRGRLVMGNDEFSHWAVTVKMMTHLDALSITQPDRMHFPEYPPATALLEYLFVRFTPNFTEGYLYRALNLLQLSLLVPYLGRFNLRRFGLACAGMGALFLLPLAFYGEFYTDLCVDGVLALLFAWTLFGWFGRRKRDKFAALWVTLGCALLTLTKSSGFALALIALALILWDSMRQRMGVLGHDRSLAHNLASQRLWLIPLGGCLAAQFSWNLLCRICLGSGGSSRTLANLASLLAPWPERYTITLSAFLRGLFLPPELEAPLRVPTILWLALGALLLGLAGQLRRTMRPSVARLRRGLLWGFGLYCVSLLYLYFFSFGEYEGTRVASQIRYLNTWLLALALLGVGLLLDCTARREASPQLPALLLAGSLAVFPYQTKQINNLVAPATQISQDQAVRAAYYTPETFPAALTEADRVYFVGDDTAVLEKLCAEYCLYPTVCDASLGHNFHLGAGYDTWADDVSPEAWADELEEHYTYVYLYSISEEFVGKYGALFAEPSSIAAGGLYRVGGSGGGLLVRIN